MQLLARVLTVVIISLVWRCAPIARAQSKPSARLIYEPLSSAQGCPDEEAVRNAVSSRLGYDPFNPEAARTISARIKNGSPGLVAEVELRDGEGKVTGSRRLASPKGDCRELASAMELLISIVVDPLVLSRRSAPAPRAVPPPESPPSLAPPAPAAPAAPPPPPPPSLPPPVGVAPAKPARDPRDKVTLRSSVGVLGTLGSAPSIALGFTAQIGLRWRLASFGLEGRADLPASTDVPGLGGVKASLLLATFVPCAHYRFLFGCAILSAGALQGTGENVSVPRQETTFYANAGTRLGAELRVVAFLYLRLHLDILATLTRTTLQIDGKDAWTTPPVSGDLGLSVAANFL